MKKTLLLFLTVLMIFCLLSCKEDAPLSEDSRLEVHFIDVGQADAALLICDGETMLIDGGNAEDSSLMYAYLKRLGVKRLDYVVATHLHEDHVGGIPGALAYAEAGTVLCPAENASGLLFDNLEKYVSLRGGVITVPRVGDTFSLGGSEFTVLACNSASGENNSSIVLRLVHGDNSFLFTGDADRAVENVMLDSSARLEAKVIKIAHHGSYDATSYPFLKAVDPEYAVISSGKGNEYGHPHDETLSRLRDAEVTVLRTDEKGDIICKSDGRDLEFNFDTSAETADADYIVNIRSQKLHRAGCANAESIDEFNRLYADGDRDELVASGFSPAGCCKP